MFIESKSHKGIVLDVSPEGFDNRGATFATAFIEEEDPRTIYLFYTGIKGKLRTNFSIGLATSRDGLNFKKASKINPVIRCEKGSFCSEEAVTPALVKVKSLYYMVFSGKPKLHAGRRIGIAYADDPKGPWRIIGELIRPEKTYEGSSIDLGPCITKLDDENLLVYYSNASSGRLPLLGTPINLIFGLKYLRRMISILKLRVRSPSNIEARRYEGNPLTHLIGPKGSWRESLFCPGYLMIKREHYLFPAASTYSVGFPYRNYIGVMADRNPYFKSSQKVNILIDGPNEKRLIMPGIKSEIGLDAPCPILRDGRVYLYYAVMDRANGIWKTSLSIMDLAGTKA